MNGITVYKHKSILQSTHQKQQKSCTGIYFVFLLCDEDFVSKTINKVSVDLDKLPASKVCHLAKKYESSKATARYIKQVVGEMQATQIHMMRHKCTELSNGNYQKQKPQAQPRSMQNKNGEEKPPSHYKKSFDPKSAH